MNIEVVSSRTKAITLDDLRPRKKQTGWWTGCNPGPGLPFGDDAIFLGETLTLGDGLSGVGPFFWGATNHSNIIFWATK